MAPSPTPRSPARSGAPASTRASRSPSRIGSPAASCVNAISARVESRHARAAISLIAPRPPFRRICGHTLAMWVAENNTPFRIERGFLRDRNGGEVWINVVKGIFDIRPDGTLRAAKEQDVPPARVAAWTGEPGKSSLLHDTDFIIGKSGTDILIQGHAYAPRGRPATSVDVGFRAGSLSKRIRAHGVRAWMRGRNSNTVVPAPGRPYDPAPL